MEFKCHKDKTRICDKNCAAYFGEGMILGITSHEKIMTGVCMELGIQASISRSILILSEKLSGKKKKVL